MRFLTPSDSDSLRFRSQFDITWTGSLPNDTLVLQYSINGGKNYRTISERVTGTSYRWQVPHDYSDSCILRLTRARVPHSKSIGTILPAELTAMALSPDGTMIATAATASGTRKAGVWSLQSGERILALDSTLGKISSFAFSPTGDTLLACYMPPGQGEPHLLFYDLRTGQMVRTFRIEAGSMPEKIGDRVYYNPLGDRIDVLSNDYDIRTFSIATGERIYRRRLNTRVYTAAAYTSDRREFVTANYDGKLRYYPIDSTKLSRQWDDRGKLIRSIAFSPVDSLIAIAGNDSVVTIRTTDSLARVAQFKPHAGPILSMQFSRDGRYLLTAGGDRVARVWEWRTQALIAVLAGHRDSVTHAAFTPDGSQVVTSSYDGTTRIWPINYMAESDTSDGMFSIHHYRPTLPDSLTSRFPYPGKTEIPSVDSVRICNEEEYPIDLIGSFRYNWWVDRYPYALSPMDSHIYPIRLDPDSCFTIVYSYSTPSEPMIDVGYQAVVVDYDTLLIPFRVETYQVAHVGDGSAVTGENRLRAFPNPVADIVRLSVTTVRSAETRIIVYGMQGQIVKTVDLGFLPAGTREIDADLSSLPSGLYQAFLWSGGEKVSTTIQVLR